jgi:hypothetical protein
MKVKQLIEKLKSLNQDKEIIINSDEAHIGEIEDLGTSYCIFGTYVIPEEIE